MKLWDVMQIISQWSMPWLTRTSDDDFNVDTLWFGFGPLQFRKYVIPRGQ